MRRLGPWLLALLALAIAFRGLGEGLVQASRDLYAHDFSDTWYLAQRWSQLEVPLWLPHARLGQPFLALLYTQSLYAPRVLTALVFGPVMGPNVMHALHAAWGFGGLYLFGRRLGLGRWAAVVGAAPFSLSPFFVEFAQNLSFASTAAWAGWVLLSGELLRRRPGPSSAAWLAVALGGAFHGGAPEIWLWEVLGVGLLLLLPRRSRASLAWGALAVALGAGLGAVVAFPAAELAREYTQPGEVPAGVTEWSMSWVQLVAIIVPDADFPRTGTYWGSADQRFLFSVFIGSLAGLFGVVGLRRRRTGALVVLLGLCLLLSLGKNFPLSELLLKLPPLRFFRYPAKYAVGALFALSVLSGIGFQRLAALLRRQRRKGARLLVGAIIFFAILLVAGRFGRSGMQTGTAWALLAVTVAAGALLFFKRRAPPVIAALVVAELLFAPHHRWPRLPAAELLAPSKLAAALRSDGAERVSIRVDMDDEDPEASGPWDEGGGDQITLRSRERLSGLRFIEEGLRATGGYGFRDPWRLREAFKHREGAFALAGVTHFVRNTSDTPRFFGPEPGLTSFEDVWVWRWKEAFPRGWVVSKARVGIDAEAFSSLDEPLAMLAREVVIDRGEALDGPDCRSEVTTTEPRPEEVHQFADACAAGYLVLADAWYPGWEVEVDGVSAAPVRAWGFLRAVRIPEGRHEVVWRYR
ncbi:MAG: hypothetical protein IT380_20425, partial [Myxococcales bacterium]|nr:hypothetical protein [Myxococcales bacterium]